MRVMIDDQMIHCKAGTYPFQVGLNELVLCDCIRELCQEILVQVSLLKFLMHNLQGS